MTLMTEEVVRLTTNPLTGGGLQPRPDRDSAGWWGLMVVPTPAHGGPARVDRVLWQGGDNPANLRDVAEASLAAHNRRALEVARERGTL